MARTRASPEETELMVGGNVPGSVESGGLGEAVVMILAWGAVAVVVGWDVAVARCDDIGGRCMFRSPL